MTEPTDPPVPHQDEADAGRWFLSWARTGVATAITTGRTIQPRIGFTRTEPKAAPLVTPTIAGPVMEVAGPADAIGFDPSLVLREEPARGSTEATTATVAHIEFAHAHLPWQLSTGPNGPTDRLVPWLALVVLRDDECPPPPQPSGAGPAVINAPSDALPDPSEYWAWAHVEVREQSPTPGDNHTTIRTPDEARAAVAADLRQRDDRVLSRLLCPRQLELGNWMACVVPTTQAGRLAGLRAAGISGDAGDPAAAPGWAWGPGTGTLPQPVYHWWTFSVTHTDSFEDLAKLLSGLRKTDPDPGGFGSRTVDVGEPWTDVPDRLGPDRPAVLTAHLDGALRRASTKLEPEVWTPGPTGQTPGGPAGGP